MVTVPGRARGRRGLRKPKKPNPRRSARANEVHALLAQGLSPRRSGTQAPTVPGEPPGLGERPPKLSKWDEQPGERRKVKKWGA